jgi:hypothetical protein
MKTPNSVSVMEWLRQYTVCIICLQFKLQQYPGCEICGNLF